MDSIKESLAKIAQRIINANLPAVSGSDNGKVLKVTGGEWQAGAETVELPAVSGSDNGKVLMVVEGHWAAASIPAELPAVTAEDVGATLAVDAEGKWAKVAAGG